MAVSKPTKAANLAREIWRVGRGHCEARGMDDIKCGTQLQGAHWFGKGSHIKICSDLRNGFSLCSTHHRRYTDDAQAFVRFIDGHPLKRYENHLRLLMRPGPPSVDWNDRIDFLWEIRRAIKAGEMTIEQAWSYEE